jgi:SAM-dependent methyltransferase
MSDIRRDSPSFHRNIEPITQKLHEILAENCRKVLEIGSGSGQHVARFSTEFPNLQFQPTEYEAENLASIDAWSELCDNVSPAVRLDVTNDEWFNGDAPKFDALLCFNVIHIAPWEVTRAIFKGANKYLNPESQIIFYGPYKIDGKHTSDSNHEFEKWLQAKDSSYGIRDVADVTSEANLNGFILQKSFPMPANNFLNVFSRS